MSEFLLLVREALAKSRSASNSCERVAAICFETSSTELSVVTKKARLFCSSLQFSAVLCSSLQFSAVLCSSQARDLCVLS